MSLNFFQNSIQSGYSQSPYKKGRNLQQAFIDSQWDNTVVIKNIEEQDMDADRHFTKYQFHKIEGWTNYVVGTTSTTKKNGDDFCQIIFKDITHPSVRGRYYRFDDNIWISDFTDDNNGIVKDLTVRRCNNSLRMIDPLNGAVFSAPCVVGYDMMSPSVQVSRYVLTPNNHAFVITQANPDTLRLFKTNTRFILGGRPFKLLAFQNTILDDLDAQHPTLLYLDLFLDEIHPEDDLVKQIAFNGEFDYHIKIANGDMELPTGYKGTMLAEVTLNGCKYDSPVLWKCDNPSLVEINVNGEFTILGESGLANISATLPNNDKIVDTIQVRIVKDLVNSSYIILDPNISKIREGENILVNLATVHQGEKLSNAKTNISLAKDKTIIANDYLQIKRLNENKFDILCLRRKKDLVTLYLSSQVEDRVVVEKEINIKLANIFE